MDAKLTLKLDKDKIEKAKQYARAHNTSLSSLVADYFSLLVDRTEPGVNEISPTVKKLSGIVSLESDEAYKDIHDAYLLEKYLKSTQKAK